MSKRQRPLRDMLSRQPAASAGVPKQPFLRFSFDILSKTARGDPSAFRHN
jgi:hypothetical protein